MYPPKQYKTTSRHPAVANDIRQSVSQEYLQHSRFYSGSRLFLRLSRASWSLFVSTISVVIISGFSFSSASLIHMVLTRSRPVRRSRLGYAHAVPAKHFCCERLSAQANRLLDCTNCNCEGGGQVLAKINLRKTRVSAKKVSKLNVLTLNNTQDLRSVYF